MLLIFFNLIDIKKLWYISLNPIVLFDNKFDNCISHVRHMLHVFKEAGWSTKYVDFLNMISTA